jgi:circadian clock protein KaiC
MTEHSPQIRPLTRMPTGIAGLDTVLRGGLPRGGVFLLLGPPGTGKTVLANQIGFHQAATGGRVVYLTLLAELHADLFMYLQDFAFFEPTALGTSMQYYSGSSELEHGGLPALLKLIHHIIRDDTPTLLIVDSLSAIELRANGHFERKQFLQQVQVVCSTYGCTTLLLAHGAATDGLPEHGVADGLLALSDTLQQQRPLRELHVVKMRGTAHLRGTHVFAITSEGIVVYPRIEALPAATNTTLTPNPQQRLLFGVVQLDALLHGGVPARSTTMLLGTTGSGKTLFGLSFIATGAAQGERGLFVSLREGPQELAEKGRQVGIDVGAAMEAGQLDVLWQPGGDELCEAVLADLLQLVAERQVQRVCIDGLEQLRGLRGQPDRFQRAIVALLRELSRRNVTTVFTVELHRVVGPSAAVALDDTSALADNLILLRRVELGKRTTHLLAVLKMRASSYDSTIYELHIDGRGLTLTDTLPHAAALLSDMPGSGLKQPGQP